MNIYEEGKEVVVTLTAQVAVNPAKVYFGYYTPGSTTETILTVGSGLTQVDSLTFTASLVTSGYPGTWIGRVWSTAPNRDAAPWAMRVNPTNVPMVPAP